MTEHPVTPEERAAQWRAALERLRIPQRFLGVPVTIELPEPIANWTGEPWSVTLLGLTGVGKTWLAVRLFGRVWGPTATGFGAPGSAPMFIDSTALVEAARREIGEPGDGATIDAACRAPGLLLDDFGAERDSEFARDRTSYILRQRYNWCRATIITSQAPTLEALSALEPRIASRLAEGLVIELEGSDRRMAAAS